MAGQIAATGINVLYQSANPKDFNLATETGIYGCGGSSAENGPTAAPYGTLIVFNSPAFGGGYSVQMFIGRGSTPSFYFRIIGGDGGELFNDDIVKLSVYYTITMLGRKGISMIGIPTTVRFYIYTIPYLDCLQGKIDA